VLELLFTHEAWADYLYWQEADKKIAKKINGLIKECLRDPYGGTGKPEALRYELAGCYSRRIDLEHRLIYEVVGETLRIISCRYHYA
jgi:toxin YoeB